MCENDCPHRGDSLAYSLGELPPDRSEKIARHVESCADCQETLSNTPDTHDMLVGHLRRPVSSDPYMEEPQYEEALAAALGCQPQTIEGGESEARHGSVGPYQLLEKLAEGGMGTVYKVRHAKLHRIMALKLLAPGRMKQGEAAARFEREMKAAGKLDHPNIVRATDAGEHEGVHFLAMEYVDGVDLSTLVRWHGRLPVAEACELIRQAALGLQHAHEHGLVHRDVKPSNLMVTLPSAEIQPSDSLADQSVSAGHSPHAVVKILDLGLAQLLTEKADELTSANHVMGTLDYMAPEQGHHAHHVDARADIYSLGATLYKLLCDQAPLTFEGRESVMQKLTALATEPVRPIRERRPDVPESLASILDRMLARDPSERYTSAAEVAHALAPLAADSDLPRLLSQILQAASPSDTVESECRQICLEPPSSVLEASESADGSAEGLQEQRDLRRGPPRRGVRLLALALGGIAAVLLGVVVYIQTQYGRVVIDTKSDDAKIVLTGGGREQVIDPKVCRSVKLWPGKYTLRVEEAGKDGSTESRSFTVKPGEEVVIEIGRPATGDPPKGIVEDLGLGDDKVAGIIPEPGELPGIARWQVRFASPPELREEKGDGKVRGIHWSPDGQLLAVASGGGHLRLVSPDGRVVHHVVGHTDNPKLLAWAPDSRRLASTGFDKKVRLWDRRLEPIEVLSDQPGYTVSAAWDAVSNRLATGDCYGKIHVRDADGRTLKVLESKGWVWGLAWSPDGRWLAAQSISDVLLWNSDLTRGPTLHGVGEAVDIAWSPDGSRLAVACMQANVVQIWTSEWELERTLSGHSGEVWAVAWSHDGSQLASSGRDGTVRIWKADGTPLHALSAHSKSVLSVSFSPDGLLASGSYDRTVIGWDADNGRPVWIVAMLGKGKSATFTAAGQLISGDMEAIEDSLIYVLRTADRKDQILQPSAFFERVPEARIEAVPASPE